ncbi:M18 family aminopeptidase [Propionicimonas sp.]|uniref:M18 family aminopeptidase n=1 Tax=Propionicimonas sp. TaxID=1955623 RepID=UPI0017E1550C|nr:M18 family aminopeptidase [Propionicimonas sp.]MBU3978014.1 M18 family aminopeptidase [Actinomycetota bacterium]MBA3021764.1 M18 family aminopeptidase [Propionicimonas sp.]MBU3985458.1 M18 family aminopeptidase [Actinomycetota bacterium]MBU4007553.1 M18 family aminopeptidase [Actinomycetota bacterium]MBU4066553.1 M18 family aminopeptidase [Actinomycetota bacterium]
MNAVDNIHDLAAFVAASPSSYHAAAEVARRLVAAGFAEQRETDSWLGLSAGYVIRDGAIIAWRLPAASDSPVGFRVVGAHTDSPGFKLKPQPSAYAFGFAQAAMEVYGGPLLNSWLDREFGLAGRVVLRSGEVRLVSTEAWLRIPQLAPHLDRSVNDGLHLDRQSHLKPVYATGAGDLLAGVAATLGVHADEIDGFDLFAAVSEAPAVIGLAKEFLASPRLDNLSSVHAGLVGLLAADASDQVQVLACFDHEEIGSDSRSGAAGPFLEDVLGRLATALGWDGDARAVAIAKSFMISADAGHSLHPNYPGLHDPDHQPVLNAGPLLKVNANQRYTTEGPGTARWLRICRNAAVPTQQFVSNNSVPCGSTIGPLSATRLGIESIDVGVPLLSMHSARELCGVEDAAWLAAALGAFYAGA